MNDFATYLLYSLSFSSKSWKILHLKLSLIPPGEESPCYMNRVRDFSRHSAWMRYFLKLRKYWHLVLSSGGLALDPQGGPRGKMAPLCSLAPPPTIDKHTRKIHSWKIIGPWNSLDRTTWMPPHRLPLSSPLVKPRLKNVLKFYHFEEGYIIWRKTLIPPPPLLGNPLFLPQIFQMEKTHQRN